MSATQVAAAALILVVVVVVVLAIAKVSKTGMMAAVAVMVPPSRCGGDRKVVAEVSMTVMVVVLLCHAKTTPVTRWDNGFKLPPLGFRRRSSGMLVGAAKYAACNDGKTSRELPMLNESNDYYTFLSHETCT